MSLDGRAFCAQLRDLGAAIHNNAAQALRAAVNAAEDDAKGTALYKDRTGALRANTVGTVDASALKGELRASTKYARYVESGTPPHVIQGRNGGMLRFVIAGRVVFRRSVKHPGTAERPFMRHAQDVGDKTLDYGAEYFTDHAITKFNQAA